VVGRDGDLIAERDPRRPSGRRLRQGDMDASYVDLADPSHLEFDYLRWMRIVLRTFRARRVLHIGGGACALARALASEHPEGRQEVCEADGAVLAMARDHLGLRRAPGLRVRHAEGRAFVARQPDRSWEAIAIDAFLGATVPRRLITVEALADVARVAPLALVNVVDDRTGRQIKAIAAALSSTYPHVFGLGAPVGNTVVCGSEAAPGRDRIAAQAAADRSPARLTEPAATAPAWRDDDLDL
jgi:spermidine synthase